ncbi:MAG: hypothetical protein QOH20_4839, partial [Mycobacterium sp.]|nr:hypothetical protein [Mycobacterium sp.]
DEKGLAVPVDAGEAFGIAQCSVRDAREWTPRNALGFGVVVIEGEFEECRRIVVVDEDESVWAHLRDA